MNININSYYEKRENLYNKIHNAQTNQKVIMAFFMACFTGIMAQIAIPLSWTPVPITLQTFAVLLSGLILGKKYGLLSQVFYLLGGLVLPWYTGMTGGLDVLLGSTGGYIFGFLIAAYFIGAISEKYPSSRNFFKMSGTVAIANFALIYIPGLAGLAITFYLTKGVVLSLPQLIIMGLAPFIVGDIIKILAAGTFSKVFLPKDE